MEKAAFMEEVNARALAEAQRTIEAKYTIDKKILMQVKRNMLHGPLVRKANHIADAEKTPDGMISLKEVASILRLVKVEL